MCALLKLCESQVHQCQQELLKLINEKKVLDRMREEQLAEYYKDCLLYTSRICVQAL